MPNASPGIPSIVFRTIHARTKLETGDALDSFKILISNVILTRWEQLNWIRTAEKTNICKFHIQLRIKFVYTIGYLFVTSHYPRHLILKTRS